ncbi:hypothetical protein B0H34DRAFT_799600 [Crassisporium funariophilum]|nr:hypothetical protein B0H34DRAFT_799600 [Crassisporium funariophilum]
MSQKLILVTGVTGFIAGHVVEQLLNLGYRVRGTVRGAKVQKLRNTVKVPGLEFFQVDDLATSDMKDALQGIYAVIHIAAPLPGNDSVEGTLSTTIEGTLNVVRQAEAAGIQKIIVTATFGNTLDPSLRPGFAGLNLTEEDWGQTSRDEILARADDPYYVYFASKNVAERALWDFGKAHPHLDITTILPGFVFGPYAKLLPLPTSPSGLGTNSFPYMLVNGGIPPVMPPWIADVRDVAKAHVLALGLPSKSVGVRRFLVNGSNFTWKQAAKHLKSVRPGINVALLEKFTELPGKASTLDTTRARKILGLEDFITPEKTMEDATDALLALQRSWSSRAHN